MSRWVYRSRVGRWAPFIVNSAGVVATANHVVEAGEEFLAATAPDEHRHVGVGLAYPVDVTTRGNFRVTPFDVLVADKQHDLALLKMRENPFDSTVAGMVFDHRPVSLNVDIAKLTLDRPKDGTPIAVSIDDVYLGDVQTNPGNSGGPVYRHGDRAVIGVLIGSRLTSVYEPDASGRFTPSSLAASADLSVIVPSRYLVDLIDRNSLEWTSAS